MRNIQKKQNYIILHVKYRNIFNVSQCQSIRNMRNIRKKGNYIILHDILSTHVWNQIEIFNISLTSCEGSTLGRNEEGIEGIRPVPLEGKTTSSS